ncbi:exo-alpha-sialidase [Arenibacter sp. BSSL-BM3]|uniref:Exo-alpha-sialidase n=1 Tax=Arenibacter arenosicollis TaxID=2762274 RepID=A0ABR7QJK6_9FLAO|nr:sialidase family protein [Arenibacter arenosicollis]MBC8767239.1 exo-alpha-sialidase [Arenibacter arenosicollis]
MVSCMCKPIVLSTGEWVLPVSTWQINDGAKAVVSVDHGQSWQVRGAVNVPELARSADEHMIVEGKDGTLWMIVRTKYGIGESVSKDKGYS